MTTSPQPLNTDALQLALQRVGRYSGKIDGDFGPLTYAGLLEHASDGAAPNDRALALGKAMDVHLPAYGIDTRLRIAHFIAQSCHETGGYRYLREIWGPTDAQRRYEGRSDLGNIVTGDGRLYLGRGMFQYTGRFNYRELGKRLGIDLEAHPERLEEPSLAVLSACVYWNDHRLSTLADEDDVLAISRAINLGNRNSQRAPNGLEDRKRGLKRTLDIWPA